MASSLPGMLCRLNRDDFFATAAEWRFRRDFFLLCAFLIHHLTDQDFFIYACL